MSIFYALAINNKDVCLVEFLEHGTKELTKFLVIKVLSPLFADYEKGSHIGTMQLKKYDSLGELLGLRTFEAVYVYENEKTSLNHVFSFSYSMVK